MGKNLHLIINISDQVSVFKFSYTPPFLANIFPSNASAFGGDVITITGQSLGSSDAVIVFTSI